jgi:hypothetical protein
MDPWFALDAGNIACHRLVMANGAYWHGDRIAVPKVEGLREKLLFDSERLSRIGAAIMPFAWLLPLVNIAGIALAIIAQFPLLVPMLLSGY